MTAKVVFISIKFLKIPPIMKKETLNLSLFILNKILINLNIKIKEKLPIGV